MIGQVARFAAATALRRLPLSVMLGLAAVALAQPVVAAWTSVGDGIDYQAFTVPGDPNNLFVCRLDRNNPNAIIDSTIATGSMTGGKEVISAQSARVNDAINWWGGSWGKRNTVVCAINGEMTGASVTGAIANSGWQAKMYDAWGGFSGFGFKTDRTPFIGGCVWQKPADQFVTFQPSGTQIGIDGTNITRASETFVIYTPQYSARTPSVSTGTEVLVQLTQPMIIGRGSNAVVGTVKQVWRNSGLHYIPFDSVVLSADGAKGTSLYNAAVVGQTISISQRIYDYNEPDTCGQNGCSSLTGLDWSLTYSSVGCHFRFLENGAVRVPDAVCHPGYIGDVNRNPLTIVAYNSNYIYFVVCDGRSSVSIGMGLEEMGHWCIDNLQATDAVALDGGGSSEMIVNGTIKNVPSDGSERAVVNGLVMCNVAPKLTSTLFGAGATVKTSSSVTMRTGPGTNYGSMGTVASGTTGTVVSHSLNGVYAKGSYWWNCTFGSNTGWVAQNYLNVGPSITQHPAAQTVSAGGTATFSVVATGSGTLSYQWQKDTVNLSNTGHYSGALTSTLTVSPADSGDVGNYRCVVTNSYGTATSNDAALTLSVVPPAPVDGAPTADSSSGITWRWTDVSGETGYRVKDTGGVTKSGDLAANTVQWAESGLSANTQYTRRIYAFSGAGESAGSAGQTKYTLQPSPTAPTYSNVGLTSLRVSTTGPVNLAEGYSGVQFKKNGVEMAKVQALYRDESGLTPNTQYTYSCRAINGDNAATAYSSTSSKYTLAKAGESTDGTGATGNVYCTNASKNTWYGASKTFEFSNPAGFGTDGTWKASSLEYKWDKSSTESWATSGTAWSAGTISVTPNLGDGDYYLHVRALNGDGAANNTDVVNYGPFKCDVTAPGAVSVDDKGDYTPLQNELSAQWTTSSDALSGLNRYEYAVGTSSTTQDILDWTSNGIGTSVTIAGLSLVDGVKYYVQARAVDNAGNPSAGAFEPKGILVAPGASPISAAWAKLDASQPLSLRNKIVTARMGGAFWLEEIDRTGAIKVLSSAGVAKGNSVSVAGVLGIEPGGTQRVLIGDVVKNYYGDTAIQPVGMTTRWLGGGDYVPPAGSPITPGVGGGVGQYNIGLLVRCWGQVTYADTSNPLQKYFYLDDGSGWESNGHKGVKVLCGSGNPPASPAVVVTGIVGSETAGGVVAPVILVRDPAEIMPL